jgi:serine protease Do
MKAFTALAVLAMPFSALQAETVKDREGAVRGDKATLEADPRWNYNDVEGGFRLAKTTGKPLLVLLRCVPCLSCAGMDAAVLAEPELRPLLDEFICVRLINANALDLSRFQFDYDLSLSVLIFHGDGTVLGRYGSWSHQKDPQNKSLSSLQKALKTALELHHGYPANREALAGKQSTPLPYATPVEFPHLATKYSTQLDWQGKVVQSCVHCHMIGDALRAHHRTLSQPMPLELIYPHPSAEVLGISLAAEEVASVESVLAGSAAEKAGLKPGDHFTALAGQPLISQADISHALHRAPDSGTLKASVKRGEATLELTIMLEAGWRSRSDISRRVGSWPMRAMAFGGMKMDDLSDAERETLGLTREQMALRIHHVGQYGAHAAAKKAGFQKDDILIEAGELKTRLTESAIIGALLRHHHPGEKLPATVLRGAQRVELQLPQQ